MPNTMSNTMSNQADPHPVPTNAQPLPHPAPVPAPGISPERQAAIFRTAVIMRLHLQLDHPALSAAEAAYLHTIDAVVEQAMAAVLATLDRVAPTR
jgi:hypothetical protein